LAAIFARAVRGHWAIGNGLHWALDAALQVDAAVKRKDPGAENSAIPVEIALNVLRRHNHKKP
jgi:predicted transposase YbfD/YdcC